MNERPNIRFSDDIIAKLLKGNELPVIDPLPGEKKLPDIDRRWIQALGHPLVRTVVFSNFNGDQQQAKNIARDISDKISPRKMAYGFTSIPDNRTPGASDSIVKLKDVLGNKTRNRLDQRLGSNSYIHTGLKHRDTGIIIEDKNQQNSPLALVFARAANNVKEKMDFLTPEEKRSHYLGNLILMHDDRMAEMVGASEDEVSGGTAYILTGYNPDYGTMQWEELTPKMTIREDSDPFDLNT